MNNNENQNQETFQKMASGLKMKRTSRDSVFTDLFSEKKYQIELLKTLCPQEEIKPEDIKFKTLEPMSEYDLYDGFCLLVKDKAFIIVEAQSIHSPNMVVKLLFYMEQTYRYWCTENNIDIYQDKLILPKFRSFVINTGNNKSVSDFIEFPNVIPSLFEPIRILKGGPNLNEDIVSE